MSTPTETATPPASAPAMRGGRWHNVRVLAAVLGFLGAALALLSGLMPVKQNNASFTWEPGVEYASVTAPLVAGRPLELDLHIPCAAAAAAEEGTVLVSTLPPGAENRSSAGMVVSRGRTAGGEQSLEVVIRNLTLLSVPLQALRSPECDGIHIRATPDAVIGDAGGATYPSGDAAGEKITGFFGGAMRPQVVGLFTEIDPDSAPPGLQQMSAHVTVDARYSSSPTLLKLLAIVLGVLASLASLYYLHQLDLRDERRHVRIMPRRGFRLTVVDAVVLATLGLWHIVGANTSDDGYLLTMARSAGPSGYMSNYYRWLGSPESPVGWYYEILKAMSFVSTASVWMRLPTLIVGIATWFVLTREVIPRLGRLARLWPLPEWAGAGVFLAFWMAFNNGLRPEPVLALGALLTWSLVERSIATRRLLPAYLAVIVAAFSIGTGPTGVICVATLFAGARSIFATMRHRAQKIGWAPVLGPFFASGFLLLFTVFADQTLASVMTATQIRTELGPSLPWYGEKERWLALLSGTSDGGVSRRFPVLLMLGCVAIVGLALIRKRGIPSVASGPARRLVGLVLGSLALLVFTPTKWTHHFGIFAGIGGALAVATVLALRPRVVASARNAWLIAAGISGIAAISTATDNVWWYVSNYGMPFGEDFPAIGQLQLNYIFFGFTIFALAMALLCHSQIIPPYWTWPDWLKGAVHRFYWPEPDTPAYRLAHQRIGSNFRSNRQLSVSATLFTSLVLALVCANMASALIAVFDRAPAYTVGRSNMRAIAGEPCSLADAVLVEENSNDGVLNPIGATVATALGAGDRTGFAPNGIPDTIPADPSDEESTTLGGITADSAADGGAEAGTTGGQGAETINGSTASLPFDLDPAQTPVLGSYRRGPQTAARLVSGWYELPARSPERPLIVVAAAGWIGGSDLKIEYGRAGRVGTQGPTDFEVLGSAPLIDVGPAPSWRNMRLPLEALPPEAEAVRIVARDSNLSPDWWLAVTPPRTPALRPLDEVVGHTDPVLLDWVVALAFPCQRPFVHNDGVAEIPRWRILPDRTYAGMANWWQAAGSGGPLLWIDQLTHPVTVPTYLNHDWSRDWGSLQRLQPFDPNAEPAELERSQTTRLGTYSPGEMVS